MRRGRFGVEGAGVGGAARFGVGCGMSASGAKWLVVEGWDWS